MARVILKPSQSRRRRKIALIKKTIIFSILVLIILGGVVYGLRRPEVRISNIYISGQESVPREDIENSVSDYISGYYLWLIPRNNIFFYPRVGLENKLLNDFHRIKILKASVKDFQGISVSVEERAPKYSWCGVTIGENDTCYFLDSNGFIFSNAPIFGGDVYIRLYGAISGDGINIVGKSFLSPETFKQLDIFLFSLDNLEINPSQVVRAEDGDYKAYLKEGGRILFSLKDGGTKPYSNLESAMATDPLRKNMFEKRNKLDYIDLRFGNKVFFMFN